MAAGHNVKVLLEQIAEFKPRFVSCAAAVKAQVAAALPGGVTLLPGAADIAACDAEVDSVVSAIPGYAGLAPTLAALRLGRHVALANKEAMVVAGPLVWQEARRFSAKITPVDSELSALYQCLQGEPQGAVDALILTASGGPFRQGPEDLSKVTPEEALKHPTWDMGKKVTLDSATLFNKGLELLESHFLFEFPLQQIEVVVHPQSLVHSLVRFKDGNFKAQIASHDMRLPIQVALETPQRPAVPLAPMPLWGTWEFYEPDHLRFPSLKLARAAGAAGGTAPAILNAADEVAVALFLAGKIPFTGIFEVLAKALEEVASRPLSFEAIAESDRETRELLGRGL